MAKNRTRTPATPGPILEPAPEPVTFDTSLQIDNGEYVVKEE